MAQDDKASLKAAKKQERAAKREQRKQTRSQMWQAFNMQRKHDKALLPECLSSVQTPAASLSSSTKAKPVTSSIAMLPTPNGPQLRLAY